MMQQNKIKLEQQVYEVGFVVHPYLAGFLITLPLRVLRVGEGGVVSSWEGTSKVGGAISTLVGSVNELVGV